MLELLVYLSLCVEQTEGTWDEVMRVIGQAHTLLHENGVVRIQSDIRIGTRTDKKQGFKVCRGSLRELLWSELTICRIK